jgi:acetolactate synthase-1/2/3 large subunit
MFANPTACHQVGEALGLATVTLILNNEEYGAVKQSIVGMYPDGYAAKADKVPLTSLQPTPDFCLTAQASRCYTEKVTEGKELPAALERAIKVATEENRQVVLDIAIRK